jgi:hypothetical protein
MKIGPLFKWFGSKWQSAKHYPQPEHDTIVEPFAGGAGYSLNHAERQVVLWDEDPHVTELWKWLVLYATSSDVMDIPVGLPAGTDISALDLSYGQKLLLKNWQRTNNVGECWTISPWGDKPGQWTANTRARVAEQIHAVKHWIVVDPMSYVSTPATWFIDPPYRYNYRYSRKLPPFDYDALVSLVQTIHRDSLLIVCEALGKNGERPDYLPFVESHRAVTSRRKSTQSRHSRELVYVRRREHA